MQHFYQQRAIGGSGDPWVNLDGRLNAPAGAAQYPTLLNAYHPGGTSDARYRLGLGGGYQPPWMVSGSDYAVGPRSTPTLSPTTLTGSNFNTTQFSSQKIGIVGNNVTVSGVDFTGWQVLVTGNNCTLTDCQFVSETAYPDTSGHVSYVYVGFDLGLAQKPTSGFTMQYCYMNPGNRNNSPAYASLRLSCGGVATIKYNTFQDSWSEHVQIQSNTSGVTASYLFYYNLWVNVGFGFHISGDHGDFMQSFTSSALDQLQVNFNTVVMNKANCNTQGFSAENAPGMIYNDTSFCNNTFVLSLGPPATTSFLALPQIHNTVNTISLNQNYLDPTGWAGTNFGPFTLHNDISGSFVAKVLNSGNVDMTTGSLNMPTGTGGLGNGIWNNGSN